MKVRALPWILLLAAGPLIAEVSVTSSGKPLVLVDEMKVWTPVRNGVPPRMVLNAWGDLDGDRPPVTAENPVTGFAEAVWADQQEGDFDIAFARWTGAHWDQVRFQAENTNELHPVLTHDDWGNAYIAWVSYGETNVVGLVAVPVGEMSPSTILVVSSTERESAEPAMFVTSDGRLQLIWRTGRETAQTLEVAELLPPRTPDGVLLGGEDLPQPAAVGEISVNAARPIMLGGGSLPRALVVRPRARVLLGGEDLPWPFLVRPDLREESGTLWITWIAWAGDLPAPGRAGGRLPRPFAGGGEGLPGPIQLAYAVLEGGELVRKGSVALASPFDRDLEAAREEVRRIVLGR